MDWKRYAIALLLFNTLGALVVYALQRLQLWLPLNPQAMANVSPDSSFNTAVSFVTNTNWQGYSGESTMNYLTQMAGDAQHPPAVRHQKRGAAAAYDLLNRAQDALWKDAACRLNLSHDCKRTPLAVTAGAGSTLAEYGEALDPVTRAALARSIETKAREMSELISNVLDLMRFESRQMLLRSDWQTLDDLIETSLRRLEAPLAGYEVELRLPTDLPPVYVDASLAIQVFTNLLDNIVKYTPAGTHIQIAAAPDRGDAGREHAASVRVTVDDDGPGLPAGDPARLFDKFQRGAGEGSIVGVGLGLAICRAIIRAHGGQIEAHARAGGGARIELTLPTEQSA